MKDFFGNELRIGQEIAYLSNASNYGPKAHLRKGVIISITRTKWEHSHLSILSLETNKRISRTSREVIGNNNSKSRIEFLEGENHL